MSDYIHAQELSAGDWLFREGDMGDNAYIIEKGAVEVSVRARGVEREIARLGRGEIVGEMALIADSPRSASARAIGDTTLLVLRRNRLMTPIEKADPLIRLVLQILAGRLETSAREKSGKRRSEPANSPRRQALNDVRDQALRRISTERQLRRAIENDQFSLHHQPLIRMSDGQLGGTEALMRWIHPENGFISPGEFIPLAEDTGMIVEMGRWALKRGLEEHAHLLNRLAAAGHTGPMPFISINVSAAQLQDNREVSYLADIIAASPVHSDQIKLELTESLIMDDPEHATAALGLLKETGVRLAIDDFGTGFSSLSYLHRFPFDTLKIDRAFVARMATDRSSQRLVRSIVKMGRALDMDIVAEGIEQHREVEALIDMNCDYGQGYLFARPMPARDLEQLVVAMHGQNWIPDPEATAAEKIAS